MLARPMTHGHVHDAFRHEDVDWARLAERQRERLPVVDAWWALLGRPVGQRLADVGCGPGVLAVRYAERGAEVLAVDLRPDALAHVPPHPKLRTLAHDLEAAPLPHGVDVMVLSDVLHHARYPDRMLRHARASTGRILVAEWDPDGPQDIGPPVGSRLAPKDVASLLREAGFEPGASVATEYGHYAIVAVAR